MATDYEIVRMEITKDRNGNDEVFVVTEIYDDDEGVITVPKWYQGDLAKEIIKEHAKTSPTEKDKTLHGLIQKSMMAHVATKKKEREFPRPERTTPPPIINNG